MLSVKHGGIKYHFLSLWYDSTWYWIPVSRTIGKHSTHLASGPVKMTDKQLFSFMGPVLNKRNMDIKMFACFEENPNIEIFLLHQKTKD